MSSFFLLDWRIFSYLSVTLIAVASQVVLSPTEAGMAASGGLGSSSTMFDLIAFLQTLAVL
jgi:hypothetical protein